MTRKLFLGLLILTLGLLGCSSAPGNEGSSFAGNVPRAWFDAPLPGTVYWPPNPCMMVAHGASPNGIAVFELTINGTAVSVPSPDTQTSLVALNRECGLTQPGEYVLLLRAQDNDGNWSGYAETSLVIAGDETPTAPPAAPRAPATPPPTRAVPTPTATAISGSVSIEQVSTGLVYIGAAACGPMEVAITARVTAPKGITVVVLFYRFSTGNSSSDFQSISMNPIGGDLYQRTLNPASLLGGAVPFDAATLQYQVIVQQSDGDTSLRTPVLADIAVQACGGAVSACSQYADQRACIANGCKWGPIPGAGRNGCQAP